MIMEQRVENSEIGNGTGRTGHLQQLQELYEKLRVMRNDYAAERELRPFRVMSNRTLCTVVITKPVTSGQFKKIKGIYKNYVDDLASLMIPTIRESISPEEVEMREIVDWEVPVGQDEMPEEELELYEIVRARRRGRIEDEEEVPEEDKELYELLRRIRMDLAKDAGWPPYCIMSNRTLRKVTAQKPTTQESLRGIKGISGRLCDESGDLIVYAILEYISMRE